MAWWTLWLVGNFAVNFAARSYTGAETAEELRTGTILYMSVAGALLAIVGADTGAAGAGERPGGARAPHRRARVVRSDGRARVAVPCATRRMT